VGGGEGLPFRFLFETELGETLFSKPMFSRRMPPRLPFSKMASSSVRLDAFISGIAGNIRASLTLAGVENFG
jgi:hypothetical protein